MRSQKKSFLRKKDKDKFLKKVITRRHTAAVVGWEEILNLHTCGMGGRQMV